MLRGVVCLVLSSWLTSQCVSFSAFRVVGSVTTNLQPASSGSETSGIAASRHNPDVLWVHDDSGNAAQLNALRRDGALAQQYQVGGVSNRDWEDLALGPGPVAGRDYLYVADIGNNALGYTSFSLLRVAEPDVPSAPGGLLTLAPEVFRFRYPSQTHNAETLWIDPLDGTPYVLTKETGTTCWLYRYPLPLDARVEKTLQLVATLTGVPMSFTGGAIAPDGRWIFARTNTVILAWPRTLGQSLADAIVAAPCRVANAQGQAEAISVTPDGRGLLAVSEGSGASVHRCDLTYPGGSAGWTAFGSGLAGVHGVPGLGLVRAPILGQAPVTVALWQGAALAVGFALLSRTAYPDGVAPFRGGWLHAAPDTVVPLLTNAAGQAALPFGVLPDAPVLHGLAVHVQAVLVDVAAVQDVALSAGLTLFLDR